MPRRSTSSVYDASPLGLLRGIHGGIHVEGMHEALGSEDALGPRTRTLSRTGGVSPGRRPRYRAPPGGQTAKPAGPQALSTSPRAGQPRSLERAGENSRVG